MEVEGDTHAHLIRVNGVLRLWKRLKGTLVQTVRQYNEERINEKKKRLKLHVDTCENTVRLACYVCFLCLFLIKFLCVQISCEIRNPRTPGKYPGLYLGWE